MAKNSNNEVKGNKLPSSFDKTATTSIEGKQEKEPKNSHFSPKVSISLLSLIFMVLVVVMLFRKFTGNNTIPTFTSFLEMLTSIKTPTIPFSDFSFTTIASDWGIFNGFKSFLNMFVSLFNVLIFLANGLMTLGSYIYFFVRWLFV